MTKNVIYVLLPLGISLAAGIIYLTTAPPFMLLNDAGNMIAAAVTLGVS
jgi:hypothetical protein